MTTNNKKLQRIKEWQKANPEKRRATQRRYYKNHRREILEKIRLWSQRNRSKRLAYVKRYQAKNKSLVRARKIAYMRRNREKVRQWQKNWQKRKRLEDLNFKILRTLRSRVGQALKRRHKIVKAAKTSELLGCSISEFILYLESKFEVGMSWENYGIGCGKWSIDHIMPCAIFDLSRPEHQKRCFHFSNQQPIWCEQNSSKNKRVLSNQYNLL